MPQVRNGLYVGSISPEVATTPTSAIKVFMDGCGMGSGLTPLFDVPAMPLGETDDASWVDAQLANVGKVSAIRRLKTSTFGTSGNYFGIPIDIVRHGHTINPDELNLRFAERAKTGYPVLQQVSRERGVETPPLQIGINTLDLAIFSLRSGAKKHFDAFVEATRREVQEVWEITGGNVFFLIETPCATILSNLTRGYWPLINWFKEALLRIVQTLPAGAKWGFHFCYGDLSNSAIGDHGKLAEKLDLYQRIYNPRWSVRMINFILYLLEEEGLVPSLVQYPLAYGKRPPSLNPDDYIAYRSLYIPEGTAVYAGAIHHGRSVDVLVPLYNMLDEVFGRRVGVSNTCGYGRHSANQMYSCLKSMQQVAAS